MKQEVTAFLVGVLFAFGLLVSGMTQPDKVVGFLDFFGAWDPSLAFVMLGAIGVHFVTYRIVMKRPSPLLAGKFLVPTKRSIDKRLIVGSILFGVGWGLAGYCPGPALVSFVSMQWDVVVFVCSMTIGMLLYGYSMNRKSKG